MDHFWAQPITRESAVYREGIIYLLRAIGLRLPVLVKMGIFGSILAKI